MNEGNLIVAQGGGPTMATNSSLCGVVEQALDEDAIGEIYGARYGLEGALHADLVDLRAEPRDTLEAVARAPGAALGSSRARLTEEDYERVLETFEDYSVQYFLYIGGNGSMAACQKLHKRAADTETDVQVIGIPQTVDNDLLGTDHCPGYGSAARYYAASVAELGRDVESLPTPVSIFETMGRGAGWLAAATALAKSRERPRAAQAPHLIYVPEQPPARERFLNDVQRVYDDRGWVVATVSEGVVESLSLNCTPEATPDDFGRGVPGGAAAALAGLVGDELRLRARSEKPGLCGRASVAHASLVDQREARALGRAGVRRIAAGERGVMVTLRREGGPKYGCAIEGAPLGEVAGAERTLPDRFVNEAGNGVTPAFHDYAAPLIGPPLPPLARLDARPTASPERE